MINGLQTQSALAEYRQKVVRHNSLMMAKFNLTLPEYKVILFAIHKLQTLGNAYITIEDFKEYLAPKTKNAKKDFIELMEKLTEQSVYVGTETEKTISYTKYKWLTTYTADFNKTGKRLLGCSVSIHEDLAHYLIGIKGNFTAIYLTEAFKLNSFASIRLFEILSMMKHNGEERTFRMTLDAFKEYVGIDKEEYNEFKYLNNRIIQKAVKELNELVGVTVSVDFERKNRKVTAIIFTYTIKQEHQVISNPLLGQQPDKPKQESPEFASLQNVPEYVHITKDCEQFFIKDFGSYDFIKQPYEKALSISLFKTKEYTNSEVITISNYEYFRKALHEAVVMAFYEDYQAKQKRKEQEAQEQLSKGIIPETFYYDWMND